MSSVAPILRMLLPDRDRALVVALLVVLAAPWAAGVPSAAAVPSPAVGHDEGPSAIGSVSSDPVGVWPLRPAPQVVRQFDPPDSTWGPGHRGVDLLGRVGEAVHAALPGVVSFSGTLAGRGVMVVDHGTTRTTYEPVVAGVAVGTRVAAGDRIGTLAVIGSHCFPRACLHWGWIADPDVYLDPLRLVGGPQPVRLLPLWRDVPSGRALAMVTPLYAAWRMTTQARGCACW
ncbi:peptidoglycan DD-metalloendopeptidase family protein [Nocardioides sp. DS6]|uniref:Peptidoglycan DD-metalloendopeptidase family protein n=1 Tax=Nocardioides eburneus TaxID=3231482 RepID=A0ABV3SU15_9ACTN